MTTEIIIRIPSITSCHIITEMIMTTKDIQKQKQPEAALEKLEMFFNVLLQMTLMPLIL